MKKIYFLAVVFAAFIFSGNAQIIEDDFEFYNLGPMLDQNPGIWRTWSGDLSGTGEDIEVVDDQANSGDQAGFIGGGGVQDAVLQLGNITSGDYTLTWQMYIPAGATGYFNIQGELPAGTISGVFNSSDIYFNQDGSTPGQGIDSTTGETFTFPEDSWFEVAIYFDVDATTYTWRVDGNPVTAAPVPFQTDGTLGGIDFFSVSANNQYWIDDVFFDSGNLAVGDQELTSFSIYPNPVQDRLNIQSVAPVESVVVYDVLGKQVLSVAPNAINPAIDTRALSSGAYLVQVTVNGQTKTVKVVK